MWNCLLIISCFLDTEHIRDSKCWQMVWNVLTEFIKLPSYKPSLSITSSLVNKLQCVKYSGFDWYIIYQLYLSWGLLSTRFNFDGEQGLIGSTSGSFRLYLDPPLQLPRTATLGGSIKYRYSSNTTTFRDQSIQVMNCDQNCWNVTKYIQTNTVLRTA